MRLNLSAPLLIAVALAFFPDLCATESRAGSDTFAVPGGFVNSSPVVWGDRVFLISATADSGLVRR
jgi:hypothetical protein